MASRRVSPTNQLYLIIRKTWFRFDHVNFTDAAREKSVRALGKKGRLTVGRREIIYQRNIAGQSWKNSEN